jgi:hypothetical protein
VAADTVFDVAGFSVTYRFVKLCLDGKHKWGFGTCVSWAFYLFECLKFEFVCFYLMICMGKMTIKKVVEENLLSSLNPAKVYLTKNDSHNDA